MGAVLTINDLLESGKYKGKTILEVFKINPGYLSWVLMNTDLLGPGKDEDFPFEEMKEQGYNPPQEVIDAYNKREEEYQDDMDSERREEEEQYNQDFYDDAFEDDMGEEGFWNID